MRVQQKVSCSGVRWYANPVKIQLMLVVLALVCWFVLFSSDHTNKYVLPVVGALFGAIGFCRSRGTLLSAVWSAVKVGITGGAIIGVVHYYIGFAESGEPIGVLIEPYFIQGLVIFCVVGAVMAVPYALAFSSVVALFVQLYKRYRSD